MIALLVDDNEINLDVQKFMLESCDLEVDTAESGEQAVAMAAARNYDLIFMDIQMPGIDGFTASARIRETNSSVPIIALSADKIAYSDRRFIESGMNGSIMKPLRQNELTELLSEYLHVTAKIEQTEKNRDVIFDREGFSALMSSSEAALPIIRQFLSVHKDDIEKLKYRIGCGNILGARELIHDIVGISGNLYCNKLFDAAGVLGAELRQGRSDSLQEFIGIWEKTIAELKSYCDGLERVNGDSNEESGDWEIVRSDFRSLCEDFDVAAAALFNKHKRLFAENLGEDKFKWLKEAVNRYDFLSIIEKE